MRSKRSHVGWLALALAGAPAGLAAADSACTCRANGQSYPLGQVICIRGELARCEMKLNNTSWRVIAGLCPQSKAAGPALAAAERPLQAEGQSDPRRRAAPD